MLLVARVGPPRQRVAAFLERIAALSAIECEAIVRSWRVAPPRPVLWRAAEDSVGDAIAAAGRHTALLEVQDEIHDLIWQVVPTLAVDARAGAVIEYLAATAAAAILVADVLPFDRLATLCAPFALVDRGQVC